MAGAKEAEVEQAEEKKPEAVPVVDYAQDIAALQAGQKALEAQMAGLSQHLLEQVHTYIQKALGHSGLPSA